MGDSSDNIPGISGVGEKTALNLVKTYGTLENLYANVSSLTGKLFERVSSSKEIAELSKTLATIDTDVDIPLNLDELTYKFPFPAEAKQLFSKLDLKNLLKKDSLFESEENNNDKVIGEEKKDGQTVFIKNGDKLPEFATNVTLSLVYDNNFYLSDGTDEYVFKIPENFFEEGISFESCTAVLKPLFADKNRKIILWS